MRNLGLSFLLFGSTAIAQTGPGGVGTSTTNALWLCADRGVYRDAGTTLAANGENVFQWNDVSGNALFASEPFSVNRPNLQTGVLNAKPVVRYSASSTDRLMVSGLTAGNQASIWVVARHTSLPSPNPGLVQGSSAGNAYSANSNLKHVGVWVNSTNTRPWGRGVRSDGTELNISQTTATTSGTFFILNNDYGASTIQQYINNATAGAVATNGTLRSWTDMAIGVQAGTESWNGDIAEVIAFNSSLGSAQRLIVANYLAAKYGLALSSGDIYVQDNPGNGNYDHDVAGIGRVNGSDQHTTARGSGIVEIGKSTYSGLNNDEYLLWGHDNAAMDAWGVTDFPATMQGRVARVWRVSEVSSSGTSVDVGNVDITFDLAGLGPVTASDLRLLVDTDGDGLFADETPIAGATNPSGTLYRFSNSNALANGRRFTIGTINALDTPLPIELIAFNAQANGPGSVHLLWSTASERNNALFEVERSVDLDDWTVVAEQPGAINSSSVLHYSAVDASAPEGLVYYRLRQTDLDGATEVSDAVAVVVEGVSDLGANVFPNPTAGPITVTLTGAITGSPRLELFDASGRSVPRSVEPITERTYRLDLSDLPPGMHVLRVWQGGRVCGVRLIRL